MADKPTTIKPIKIRKKKDKRCPNCRHYALFYCKLAGPKKPIPQHIFDNSCSLYKKNKHLYF